MSLHSDILVVGAGPAGLSFAAVGRKRVKHNPD